MINLQEVNEDKLSIELYLSLQNLDNIGQNVWICYLTKQTNSNNYLEKQQTEIVQGAQDPQFIEPINVDYIFEEMQEVRFEIRHGSSKQNYTVYSKVDTNIAKIVGSAESTCNLKLDNQESFLTARAEKSKKSHDLITLNWQGKELTNKKCFLCSIKPLIRFYRTYENNKTEQLIYESESQSGSNPSFKQMKISIGKLCDGQEEQPVKVKLYDSKSDGNHVYLGEFKFSYYDISVNNRTSYTFTNPTTNNTYGSLNCNSFDKQNVYTHFDYIKGGTELALVIATDFTSSNKNPNDSSSLHSLSNPQNPYRSAMSSVGQILLNYDDDKKVPMFGFGARPHVGQIQSDRVLHCFPMNGNPLDPEVYDIQGIMSCYDNCVRQVDFHGPTLFAPILREMIKVCTASKENQNEDIYFVLEILTDGIINDMDETKKLIIDCCELPLSIIIIGVGDADFTDMEILDGDDGLTDYQGRSATRDLVQFVPFNKFHNDKIKLAVEVLEELPRQMVEYMTKQNYKPGWCIGQIQKRSAQQTQQHIQVFKNNNNQQQQQQQQQEIQMTDIQIQQGQAYLPDDQAAFQTYPAQDTTNRNYTQTNENTQLNQQGIYVQNIRQNNQF